MSLAYSSYESNSELDSGDNYNQKPNQKQQHSGRRYALNKTMKKTTTSIPQGSIDSSKVNSVLQKIHSMSYDDSDEEEDNYGSGFASPLEGFYPPEKPISAGVLRTQDATSNPSPNPNSFTETQGSSGPDLDVTHSFQKNYPNKESAIEYYKKFIPNFNPKKMEGYTSYNSSSSFSSNEDIVRKLNYMIHLLEEQKDEKTGNVTEEVVLYCFLGVFIIFVVDSFARVGKYVR
jgi:hypothetical protein